MHEYAKKKSKAHCGCLSMVHCLTPEYHRSVGYFEILVMKLEIECRIYFNYWVL